VNFCARCHSSLSPLVRSDSLYCGTRCRVAAHRSRPRLPFPVDLIAAPRWVRRNVDKVPLRLNGRNASSTDSSSWSDYESAAAGNAGVGLGFVVNGDGIVCVDLDHCLDESATVAGWAQTIVDSIPRTFVEVSPSGDGLHVWGRSDFVGGRRIQVDGGMVEVYATGRYLTMTGKKFSGSSNRLADLSRFIDSILGG